MAVQIPSSPNALSCITWGNRISAKWDEKRKKNISKFNHYNYVSALITVHSTVFAVLCSSKFMWCCLEISMNSKSDWLKSEAEHYQHCYQRMENASPCLCLHKWLILRIFTVSSCTTKQFDKLSTKVLEIWVKMCQMCIFNQMILHWIKINILLVLFSPDSAEADVGWGWKLNGHLTASCVMNMCTKNY